MINKIFKVVKKIIIAIFMVYGLNIILSPVDILIPINMISICIITFLGIPGLCTLIGLFFIL